MLGLGRLSEQLSRAPSTVGTVVGDFIALRTPDRPDHVFGNRLLAPLDTDPSSLWDAVIAYDDIANPERRRLRHRCVTTEVGLDADLESYRRAAHSCQWEIVVDDVLILNPARSRAAPRGLVFRPLAGPDWETTIDHAVAADGFVEDGLREWLLKERRELVEQGRGVFMGAWSGTDLVASCGLFGHGPLLRLDQMLVDHRHRHKGYGSGLISHLSQVCSEWTTVLEPSHGNWRSEMYQALGYDPVGRTISLFNRGDQVGELCATP